MAVDLLGREAVEVALSARRRMRAAEEGAGHVGEVAVRADQIGIEGDEIAGLDPLVAGLLVPRVGAGARTQQSCLEILAAERDVGLVENRPERVLGDAGL